MGSHAGIHEERLPQLVHQILGGSAEALGELYVAFAEDVFRAAHRVLGSTPDAEDITADVFLGLAAALQNYNHSSIYGFRRWLDTITARRAPAARPDQPIDRLALDRALDTLTPALRTVFLLRAVEGYSHQEISVLLGIAVGASKVRLHRAHRELRLLLDDGP